MLFFHSDNKKQNVGDTFVFQRSLSAAAVTSAGNPLDILPFVRVGDAIDVMWVLAPVC